MTKVDESGATDADYRWEWLSTVVTITTIVSYTGIVVYNAFYQNIEITIPQSWFLVYSLGYVSALIYALGPETVKFAKSLRKKP